MKDIFIFTEAYGCGIVLRECLKTFHAYHDEIVHIYGTPNDFIVLEEHPNNVYIDVSKDADICEAYNHGHLGTAMIFSKAIRDNIGKYILHFDSDIIFLDNCLNLLYDKISEGYDLIGPCRPYRNNPNGRDDVRHLTDVTQTYIMAVNTSKIGNYSHQKLIQMCAGYGENVIDFFDPVSFDILAHGGRSYFFDSSVFGGINSDGERDKTSILNEHFDCGSKLMHFAGIGSGYKFAHSTSFAVLSYQKWAIKRWALYSKLFLNDDLPQEVDYKVYNDCKRILEVTKKNGLIDLNDVTIIIPVLIDSNDRIKNLATNIRYILKHFNTNIIIAEQNNEFVPRILSFAAGSYEYLSIKTGTKHFMRGKLFNEMIRSANTDLILNYDCDVLMPADQYVKAAEMLRSEEYDCVYPYDDNFYDISDMHRGAIYKELNISCVTDRLSEYKLSGSIKRIGPQEVPSVGGAVMIKRDAYINGGMENEYLINWAADDQERIARFKILGYNIGRVSGDIFHMHHTPSATSSNPNHSYHRNNDEIIAKIKSMNRAQIIDEINSWEWMKVKNYE